MGYHKAGFDVIGVDIKPQPHYPFEFHQADALTYPLEGFDAIHASPPCQLFSALGSLGKQPSGRPNLIPQTRSLLAASGLPYVIENVPGAPLLSPIVLCGSSFGINVRRHRLFECNAALWSSPCVHGQTDVVGLYGDHPQDSRSYRMKRAATVEAGQAAIGIDWMPWRSLTQAIPPAYTEFIGEQLLEHLSREEVMSKQTGT
jgi:DNA (cytosine-5)-methyltransferase 1